MKHIMLVLSVLLLSACAHDPACDFMARLSQRAGREAVLHAVTWTGCPRVRIVRTEILIRRSGERWAVVEMNVCGERRIYEMRRGRWRDATWRLR